MTTDAEKQEIQKRLALAARGHLAKAMSHLGKAAGCQKTAMGAMRALHNLHAEQAKKVATAKAAGAADVPFPHAEALGHCHKCASALSEMNDHHELAQHHLGKMAAGENLGPGDGDPNWMHTHSSENLDQSHLTEGGVPALPDGQNPMKAMMAAMLKGEFMSKPQVDALIAAQVDAAFQKGRAEALERMPAPVVGGRPLAFDVTKVGGGVGENTDDVQTALMKGIDLRQLQHAGNNSDAQRAATAVASKMIGNMISGGLGRNPITDPTFRGAAG
jgi:hypothetical protein